MGRGKIERGGGGGGGELGGVKKLSGVEVRRPV